jgi:hypothetical protein
MQAIVTKYLPSGHSGARMKASAAAKTILIPYDMSLRHGDGANHRAAAEALVARLGWTTPEYGTLVSGCMPNGDYCHVLTCRDGKGG